MNRRTLTKDEFNEIKELAEELAYSPTKADGASACRKLEFKIAMLRGKLIGDFNNCLGKMAAYAKSASGQVRDKSRWIDAMEEKLYVLESMLEGDRQ